MELAIVIPDDYAYDCFRVPAAKLGGRCVYTKGSKHCSEVIGYACVEGQCFEWPLDGELGCVTTFHSPPLPTCSLVLAWKTYEDLKFTGIHQVQVVDLCNSLRDLWENAEHDS